MGYGPCCAGASLGPAAGPVGQPGPTCCWLANCRWQWEWWPPDSATRRAKPVRRSRPAAPQRRVFGSQWSNGAGTGRSRRGLPAPTQCLPIGSRHPLAAGCSDDERSNRNQIDEEHAVDRSEQLHSDVPAEDPDHGRSGHHIEQAWPFGSYRPQGGRSGEAGQRQCNRSDSYGEHSEQRGESRVAQRAGIDAVAARCGLDGASLRTHFSKKLGVSPAAYRSSYR